MDDAIGYLLAGDPAIRWQVMRDLTDAPAQDVARERARVAVEGWGARLLAEQSDDGLWDGGVYRPGWVDEERPFFDAWTATHFSLQSLWEFGLDPACPQAQHAIGLVREHVRWDHGGQPYFHGEVEPCVNGIALAVGSYFGQSVEPIVATILGQRLRDGGWNCWADEESARAGTAVSSFHSTMCVVDGLREWIVATGGSAEGIAALAAAEEYLLERGLYRRRSTGEPADPRMTMLSYPTRWYHDILRGLEHFRLVDRHDDRLADAVELLRGKAGPHGLFPYENAHQGPQLFEFEDEGEGFPSRWVTLRALRVLRWWDAAR